MNFNDLDGAKRTLFIALAFDIAVTAAFAVFNLWAVGVLESILSGSKVSQSTISALQFGEKYYWVGIFTLIGVGVALVRWLGSAYQYAKGSLHATGFVQEKWKSWGWVTPFVNVFKPYQVLNEIYKAGTPRCVGDDWKKSSSSGLLLIWWVFWVIAHFILWSIGKEVLKGASQNDLTLSQAIGNLYVGLTVCVISLVVGGLWYVVVGSLTSRLLNRSVEFRDTTSVTEKADFADTARDENYPATATRTVMDEEAVYAQIAKEIESGSVNLGLWTRLLAQADGDEKRTKILYIKQRAERIFETSGFGQFTPENTTAKAPFVEKLESRSVTRGTQQPSEGYARGMAFGRWVRQYAVDADRKLTHL